MDILTKYITPDDFREYFGIDLTLELKSSANPSDTPEAFIKRIENRLETFLDAEFGRRIDTEYPKFTDYQKEHYQLALLEQAIYIFKNGDISVDSGYNLDTGEVADNLTILRKSIAPNTRMELIRCGLWSAKIRGSRGHGRLW